MNLVEYLARATEYLERNGIAPARLNAEILLCHVIDISRLDIYTGFERQLTDAQSAAYKEALVRRAGGCPLQYITGETGFRGLDLEVRPGVFIPRPETEVLVEKALEGLAASPGAGGLSVLDLGTGCGNIAVSIAAELPDATVIAVDSASEAVALCEANASKAGVLERVRARHGDLFGPLEDDASFDLIISNPPYVPEGMRASLPAEVRDHEPEGALFAGPEGLDVIRRIVDGAGSRLAVGGLLALEVDESHADVVAGELAAAGWSQVEVFEDLAGRQRVVRARKPERKCL